MPAEGTDDASDNTVRPSRTPSPVEVAVRYMLSLAFAFLLIAEAALAATVAGRVVDAASGKPLAGVRVQAVGLTAAATTGADGRFSLNLPEGQPVTVVASLPGYRVERVSFPAPPAKPLEISLEKRISFADRIEVTAARAREGRDPATFTNIPKRRVEENYWGQDPAILLSTLAPGFYAYNDSGNGIGYSYFSIRGFNQAATRVTLNGAPLNDAESGELFFIDLADFLSTAGDIQVQRGVFGLSGIGGAVDITTAMPAVEPSFSLFAGGGSYDTRRLTAHYESGLINGTWALSARYSKITTDGYRDQSWVDMWNFYISLAHFGEHSSVRLNLFGGPEVTHLAYDGIPNSILEGGLTGNASRDRRFNPLTFPGETDHFTQPHFQILHQLQLSPALDLSETFFLFQGSGYYEQFRSGASLVEYDLPDVALPDGSVVTSTDLVRRRNVVEVDAGLVPTLTYTHGDWTIIGRGEVRYHKAHHEGDVRWAQFYPVGVPPNHHYYDYQVEKTSLIGELRAAWRATDRLTVSVGLEGARHQYDLSRDEIKDVAFTQGFNFLLPRAGAIMRLGEGIEAYANVARGGREPAFRDIYDPEDYYGTRVHLNPEDLWDYEAGVTVLRPSWRLRANAFWMRFANEIVYAGALDDNGVPIYGNGAQSRHRGIEMEGSWNASPHFGADASLTLSRNTFTRYREYGYDGGVNVYDGNLIAGYPQVLAAVTLRGTVGPVRLSLMGRRVGKFYLDNTQDNRRHPELRQQPGYVALINPAFTLVDLAASVDLPREAARAVGLKALRLDARVNNLFDKDYTAFGYVDSGEPLFIPAATRNVFVGLSAGL